MPSSLAPFALSDPYYTNLSFVHGIFLFNVPAWTHKNKFTKCTVKQFSHRKESTQSYRMLIFMLNIVGGYSRAGAEPGGKRRQQAQDREQGKMKAGQPQSVLLVN